MAIPYALPSSIATSGATSAERVTAVATAAKMPNAINAIDTTTARELDTSSRRRATGWIATPQPSVSTVNPTV